MFLCSATLEHPQSSLAIGTRQRVVAWSLHSGVEKWPARAPMVARQGILQAYLAGCGSHGALVAKVSVLSRPGLNRELFRSSVIPASAPATVNTYSFST